MKQLISIEPSILSADFARLGQQAKEAEDAGAACPCRSAQQDCASKERNRSATLESINRCGRRDRFEDSSTSCEVGRYTLGSRVKRLQPISTSRPKCPDFKKQRSNYGCSDR